MEKTPAIHNNRKRKRLKAEAQFWLNAPEAEALVPIGNDRKTRHDVRNMPNIEIAN